MRTLGTSATNTLQAFNTATNNLVSDIALVRANIKWDWAYVNGAYVRIQAGAVYPGGFEFATGPSGGLLHIPRRGVLKVLPGDYVAYDPNGWPILVSGGSINSGSGWTHS